MKEQIIVKESTLDDVINIFNTIKEFDRKEYGTKEYIENRFGDKKKVILVAYINSEPVGYILAYDRDNNGSFYCWMTGVKQEYRRMGILTKLMKALKDFAKENGYKSLSIKTNNDRREMLNFLVKTNWNFISVETKENIVDNEINLTIELDDFNLLTETCNN